MRQLTKKQKTKINAWIRSLETKKLMPWQDKPHLSVDDMDLDTYNAIDKINPCEIYHQNLQRYLSDYSWAKILTKL